MYKRQSYYNNNQIGAVEIAKIGQYAENFYFGKKSGLMDARLAVREEKERSAIDKVKAAYGEKYDPMMMHDSKRDVADLLHEETEDVYKRQAHYEQRKNILKVV